MERHRPEAHGIDGEIEAPQGKGREAVEEHGRTSTDIDPDGETVAVTTSAISEGSSVNGDDSSPAETDTELKQAASSDHHIELTNGIEPSKSPVDIEPTAEEKIKPIGRSRAKNSKSRETRNKKNRRTRSNKKQKKKKGRRK